MVKDIKASKVQAIIVKKIDRLSRSLLDFEAFMTLLQEKDIEFISLKENFDTTSAMGKAMLRVALVFAQLEREQTSERLIDIFEYRASQGLYNGGTRPFGYTNVNKELVPYPKERQIVELIFDKFIEAKSTTQVARFLNETGYRNRSAKLWDKRQIQKILQSPVYLGKIKWKTNLYQGIHQPLVTELRYNETQAIFNKRKYLTEKSSTKALLQKLLFCGYCGSPMTPSHALNKIKIKYYYYRCTSTHSAEKGENSCKYKYVPFKQIEPRLVDLLLSLADAYHFKPVELKIDRHNQIVKTDQEAIESKLKTYELMLTNTKARKEKYLDSLIISQFMSNERELIKNKINELNLEEKQTQAEIYKHQFELNKKQEEIINKTDFKQLIISFKADYETFNHEQLKEYLCINLQEIIYYPKKLAVRFRRLSWSLDFSV